MVTAKKGDKLEATERSARAEFEALRAEQVQLVEDLRSALLDGDAERAIEIQ